MAKLSGLSTTCFGLMFVWPSYTLPMLASNNTILSAPLTAGNEAMLGSLPSLGGIIGTMLVGTLIDSMGRKWSSITGSVIMMISWCIVAFTNSITVVLVARFLGGVSCGLALVITPIYISEIAEDRVRGILSSVMVLLYSLGLLISYFIGWYFSYQAIAWINFAFSAARGLMLLFVPESPVYLLKKRRVEVSRGSKK
ncbi:facilitated trehalose transporter Tret1-like [Ostrinia furnacalis]|uniref:facilitated trehalose transporter Tret1-like n=1 Tax=Ostrinia furnacalis TaxID=93504 RepID=UPI00103FE47D|nr:facilitated trehalose transporter Tret1-like [Ostrinia furnacalis]